MTGCDRRPLRACPRILAGGVAAAACVFVLAARVGWNTDRIEEGCPQLARVTRTLVGIVHRGESALAAYLADGTITQAQYERALAESRRTQRELGRPVDCSR